MHDTNTADDTTVSLSDDTRGVSPVIGVVLMIALAVVMASVTATFALGWGDSLEPGASASVTVDGSDVTITSMGPSTTRVACVDSTGSEVASGNAVGATLDCESGNSVVAVGGDGTGDRTIRAGI